MARPGRPPRRGADPRPARHRRPGRPPHPRAVRRSAAAGVPGPGPAPATGRCCCSTSRRRASTCAPATRCCTCSPSSTATAWPSCSPPTTSTASPPTCPTIACLNRTLVARRTPGRRADPRDPRGHLRRPPGGADPRRDPGGRRRPHGRTLRAVDGRELMDERAPTVRLRVLPQRPGGRDRRRRPVRADRLLRRAPGHELHRSRAVPRHLRRVRRQLGRRHRYFLGAGVWGLATALLIGRVSRRGIGNDAAIAVVTTASFALGLALIAVFGTPARSADAALFGNVLGCRHDRRGRDRRGHRRRRRRPRPALPGAAVHHLRPRGRGRVRGAGPARIDLLLMLMLTLVVLVSMNVHGRHPRRRRDRDPRRGRPPAHPIVHPHAGDRRPPSGRRPGSSA